MSNLRIELIGLDEESIETVKKWTEDSSLRRLIGSRKPVSDFEHKEWYKNKSLDKSNLTLLIRKKESNKVIGIVGSMNTDYVNRVAEVFIYIGDENEKFNGYGKESLKEMLKILYFELNIRKVQAKIFEYNDPSKKMFESFGFKKEAVFKKHQYRDKKYYDVIIMSHYKEEFIY